MQIIVADHGIATLNRAAISIEKVGMRRAYKEDDSSDLNIRNILKIGCAGSFKIKKK